MPSLFPSITAVRSGRSTAILSCLAMCTLLSGCFSLHGKAPAETAAVSQPNPAEPMQDVASSAPQPVAKKPGGLYTDPMVTAASRQPQRRDPRQELPLRTPPGTATQSTVPMAQHAPGHPPAVAATPSQQTQPAMQTANSLGEVVAQPTGIQANQNSIFALANAQVAAASDPSIPAYAPTRNINAVAGSMFAVRGQPEQAPPPAQTSQAPPVRATPPKSNDGLW